MAAHKTALVNGKKKAQVGRLANPAALVHNTLMPLHTLGKKHLHCKAHLTAPVSILGKRGLIRCATPFLAFYAILSSLLEHFLFSTDEL
jgi:hypothetical protein